MRVIVIGGGAAGMMFSTQYKKSNPDNEVIVLEKSKYVSWAGCPTPYYIADELPFDSVVLNTPESFIAKGIDVRIHHEVLSVNFTTKTIEVKSADKTETMNYDKLIVAVGGRAFVPEIKGYSKDIKNIFRLTHAEDAEKIKQYMETEKPKKAVVVGFGFIGLEMTETFKVKGLDVTVIEKVDDIFPALSKKIKQPIYDKLNEKEINMKLSTSVTEIISDNNVGSTIVTDTNEKIDFDIALLSIGITPNIDFLNNELTTEKGKIIVDDNFKTNIEDVYAIGDCIANKYRGTDMNIYEPLGDVANKHGIVLSKHLSGKDASWKGTIRTSAMSFFEHKVAQTGITTIEEAEQRGIEAARVDMKAMYKNSSFADASYNVGEVLYDVNKGVVIGASMVGPEAVAQFIDQLAIVITFEIPIEKFIEIDFGYSPTNASVWNPLLVTYRKYIK